MFFFRSCRSQIFFKIGAFENSAVFWIKKKLQPRYGTHPVAASSFLKSNLKTISKKCKPRKIFKEMPLLWCPNNFFFSKHFWIVRCIKRPTCLLINMSSINRFSKELCQGVPYKAKNWHTLSHEQYFSKHRFVDTSRCVFNIY